MVVDDVEALWASSSTMRTIYGSRSRGDRQRPARKSTTGENLTHSDGPGSPPRLILCRVFSRRSSTRACVDRNVACRLRIAQLIQIFGIIARVVSKLSISRGRLHVSWRNASSSRPTSSSTKFHHLSTSATMANYQYDEGGGMAAYFILTLLCLILVPVTFSSLYPTKSVCIYVLRVHI